MLVRRIRFYSQLKSAKLQEKGTEEQAVVKSGLSQYKELTKFKLSLLNSFVSGAAFMAAGGALQTLPLLLLSTQAWAMSSQVFNQLIEKELDSQMERTKRRPLVTGSISTSKSWATGAGLLGLGLSSSLAINPATTLVAFATWFSYLFAYTPLKRKSSTNTLLGAAVGAGTVYMGWCASGASVCQCQPLALFLYMVAWQLQHFFAIRWSYQADYDRCFKMEQCRSMAILQSCAAMGLALLAGNYSLTYCHSNPYGLLNLVLTASIFKHGFMSLRRFEQDHNSRTLKTDSYKHFLVFFLVQGLALLAGRNQQAKRSPFDRDRPFEQQLLMI